MSKWFALPAIFLLFADIPRMNSLRQPANPYQDQVFPPGEEIPLFPTNPSFSEGDTQNAQQTSSKQHDNPNAVLQDDSKLYLIRYVSGEFAKAVKPLPGGKDGFLFHVGQPLNGELLDRAVATHGAAINTGDNVQISKLEFRDRQIIVDLNGGGRGKKRLRDRIHVDFGGIPTAQVTPQNAGPPGVQPGAGSTVFLEFSKAIPDLSPDDLKQILSPFLDFSKQRSAAVQWVDTLPPEMKKAIQERRPVLGMDREELVAAIGRPDHKVRERDADGEEIEDWIYGQPPSKTIFVRFVGDHVSSIKQFPQ